MTKTRKIITAFLAVLVLAVVIDIGYHYWLLTTGRAFEYQGRFWTKKEFDAVYGGPNGFDTPAKNTPEQVYAQFREALLKNNPESALQLIVPERQNQYRELFKDPKVFEKYKTIPPVDKIIKLEKESVGNYASYIYKTNNVNEIRYSLDFEKNKDGYWLIRII